MIDYKDPKAVLELCEKMPETMEATHGEWDCEWECGRKDGEPACNVDDCQHIKQYIPAGVTNLFSVDCGDFMGLSDDAADFIALSRQALPYMAAEVERLRAENERLKEDNCMLSETATRVIEELHNVLAGLEG